MNLSVLWGDPVRHGCGQSERSRSCRMELGQFTAHSLLLRWDEVKWDEMSGITAFFN